MSERTLLRRCCRSRASATAAFRRFSSDRCSVRTSRCRDKLFCFREDVLNAASESRSRDSCDMRASRFSTRSCTSASFLCSSSDGFWGRFGADAYCEYVWNTDSVWLSSVLSCCRNWAHPDPVDMSEWILMLLRKALHAATPHICCKTVSQVCSTSYRARTTSA